MEQLRLTATLPSDACLVGSSVLTSLLPGLRELRAPLAAGALWLLAAWFVVEPRIPGTDEAAGTLASLYRLGDLLSVLGWGAVLGFAAYLVGSLSVFLFSGLLGGLIDTSAAPRRWRLDGLSANGREALAQVARDSRQRLDEILSLSGSGVDDVLEASERIRHQTGSKVHIERRWWRRSRAARAVTLHAGYVPRTADELQEGWLASRVADDLVVVADAQLLGKENDVFAAVDRDRAEVDFRIAVVPSLVALTLSVAFRQTPVTATLAVVVGTLATTGLMLDAARQQRQANDLLLNLLEHARVKVPSLVRLESRATELADQSPAKVALRQASATSLALQGLIAALESVPSSTSVAGLQQALQSAVLARREFDRLQDLLRQSGADGTFEELDGGLINALERVLRGWAAVNRGLIPMLPEYSHLMPEDKDQPVPDSTDLLGQMKTAREAYAAFVEDMRTRIAELTTREAIRRGLTADE